MGVETSSGETGRYAAAERAYTQALQAAEALDSPMLEARILTNIASAQFPQGELDEAEQTALAGLTRGRSDRWRMAAVPMGYPREDCIRAGR